MSLPDRVRAWLNEETAIWTKEGLIGEAQRERILARYPANETGSNRMTFVLRALGVLTLFAAILLVIGHNWEDLSRVGRMAVVVTGLIALQSIGLSYLIRGRTQGATLGLLGSCLMYGAAIALTGQIFHLDAHAPDALLAWCLGVLPFALLLDATLLHLLVIGLAASWYSWELGMRGHWSGAHELTALAFLLLLAPSAWAGYRTSRPALVGLVAFGWLLAGVATIASGSRGFNPVFLVAPLALAGLHHPGDPRSRGWRVAGVMTMTVLTLLLGDTQHPVWRAEQHYLYFWQDTPLLTLLGLAAIALGIWKARDRHGRHGAWLAAATAGTFTLLQVGRGNPGVASLCIALGNVLTLGLVLAQIRLGLAEGRLRPYVYGCVVFFIWLAVRYMDIEKELGMLGMAAVFAVIGLGLFALARLWRSLAEEPVHETMTDFRTPAAEALFARVMPRASALLIAACALQVAVIGYMVWNHLQPLWHGERIVVRAELIDPRDLLKGEYVTLSYDFNRLDKGEDLALRRELEGGKAKDATDRLPEDTVVFVPMVKRSNGEWGGGKPTLTRPASGIYLQGLTSGGWRNQLRFGIEAYYVEEGTGKEWEKLRNSGLLKVTVAVLPNGQAGLVGIEADKEPFVELKGWRVLRGWKAQKLWTDSVVQDAQRMNKQTERSAGADAAPDLTKERIVILEQAAGLPLKVESNGNITRILAVRPPGDRRYDRESVVIAIPRNQQKIYGENGRRIADEGIEPEDAEQDDRR